MRGNRALLLLLIFACVVPPFAEPAIAEDGGERIKLDIAAGAMEGDKGRNLNVAEMAAIAKEIMNLENPTQGDREAAKKKIEEMLLKGPGNLSELTTASFEEAVLKLGGRMELEGRMLLRNSLSTVQSIREKEAIQKFLEDREAVTKFVTKKSP